MVFFVGADNLMTLFLGLEWFSLCLYVMCALDTDRATLGRKYLLRHGNDFGELVGRWRRFADPKPTGSSVRELAKQAAKPVQEFPVFLDYEDDVYSAVEAAVSDQADAALQIAGKQERAAEELDYGLEAEAQHAAVVVEEVAADLGAVGQLGRDDEPRGVDVGAIEEIHAIIRGLADDGVAVRGEATRDMKGVLGSKAPTWRR